MVSIGNGLIVDLYFTDATSAANDNGHFWSTTTAKLTVPSNRRWLFYGAYVSRDVSSTLVVYLCNAAGEILHIIDTHAAATGGVTIPQSTGGTAITGSSSPFPMSGGMYIYFLFGTAQSTAAKIGALVEEFAI